MDLAHGPNTAGTYVEDCGNVVKVKHDLTTPWLPPVDRSRIASNCTRYSPMEAVTEYLKEAP